MNSTKRERLVVELDSDTTAESGAHERKPTPKKRKGDESKSLQPDAAKKKKNAIANVPAQPQARQQTEGSNEKPKEEESPNEASDHGTPHPNEPAAPKKATSAAEL